MALAAATRASARSAGLFPPRQPDRETELWRIAELVENGEEPRHDFFVRMLPRWLVLQWLCTLFVVNCCTYLGLLPDVVAAQHSPRSKRQKETPSWNTDKGERSGGSAVPQQSTGRVTLLL